MSYLRRELRQAREKLRRMEHGLEISKTATDAAKEKVEKQKQRVIELAGQVEAAKPQREQA